MRVKGSLVILALALLLAIPHLAMAARAVHDFDCKECHLSGYTINQLGGANVCLRCHNTPAPVAVPMIRTSMVPTASDGIFVTGDASNQYGNNTAPAAETSHNWAATSTRPAAGAVEPNRTLHPGFYSRYGTTVGKVACSRCHDPHGESVVNPKLLPLKTGVPMTPNDMCKACHATFAVIGPAAHGLLSHPVGMNYAASVAAPANAGKYQAVIADPAIALMADGTVSCTTCHGVHAVDSDASTVDGFAGNPGSGDGLLLRGDGTQFINDPAKSTTFCSTCHIVAPSGIQAIHGSGGSSIGCMGCHGGHNYNNNSPSYYMLKDNYKQLPREVTLNAADPTRAELWGGNISGTVDGFCETCHGDITAGPFNAVRTHIPGEDCSACHQSHAEGSFSEPIGCDGCHGSPPQVNSPGNLAAGGSYVLNGYAWAPSGSNSPGQYDYSGSGHQKNESTTPHTSHAGAGSNYKFQCQVCHNTHIDNFAGTHNKDNTSFRDVLEVASPFDSKVVASGAGNPAYNDGHPAGTCSTVYCHSNGGVSDGLGARAFGFNNPQWSASGAGSKGSVVGTGNECFFCHGNSTATMTTRGNSAAHQKHLSQGFDCNLCHVSTATSSTDLVGVLTSPPATHINQTVNVAFDSSSALKSGGAAVAHGSTPYSNATSMTCSAVYCHSTGRSAPASRTYQSITWKTAGPLTCTSCHDITSGVGQTAAHAAHVNGSTSNVGRDLNCVTCHDDTMDAGSNIALGLGGLAFHVNGKVEVKMPASIDPATNCTTSFCHSDGNLDSVTDHSPTANAKFIVPTWTTTGSYNACDKCHGNDTQNKAYPAYADGNVGTTNANSHNKHVGASNISCEECHATTTANGTSIVAGGTHVNNAFDVSGAKIDSYTPATDTCSATSCHGAGTPQWGGVVVCGSCHAANNTLAQSHPAHYDAAAVGSYTAETNSSTVGNYLIQCGVCHSTNGAGAISHAGGWVDNTAPDRRTAEVNFDGTVASGTYTAGAAETLDNGFYYTNATCSALYCHGNFGGNGNAATATWGNAASGACGTCHDVDGGVMNGGSHSRHVVTSGITCNFCHGATAVNAAGGIANKALHVNRALNWDLAQAGKPQTAGATYNAAATGTIAAANVGIAGNYAQCNNLYCHSTVQAVPPNGTVGVTFVAPTWGGAAACGSCHKGDAAGVEQDTASHLIHTDADQYGSRFACSACHDGAGTGTTKHADYAVDVNINSSFDRGGAGAGVYSGTPAPGNAYGSCTNLTCHSNGRGGNPLVVPTWNVALTCAGCHDVAKAGTTLSGAHGAHTFGGGTTIGRNLGCQECHADTVSNNSTLNAATGIAKHVNFLKDLRVPNFGAPQVSCATVYCHSNGNAGNLVYNNPTWSASYGCATCHGNGTVSYPVYANVGPGVNANSHTAHMVGASATCNDCHAEVSTLGTSINGTVPIKHVNNILDVAGAKIGSFAAGTCSTVVCHGGNNATWGTTLGCRDCHGNATTDTDNFVYNDGTLAKIALTEWSYSGHGKLAAANYDVTGRAGAALDTAAGAGDGCLYCHDDSVGHGAANLFRLRDNALVDLNGACLGCHATGSTGVDPDGAAGVYASKNSTVKIDKYHGGAGHNLTDRDAGRFCWDCHDPHGDAAVAGDRIQMIQRRPQVNPNAMGVPASLVATDVIFTDRTVGAGANGFARAAAPFAQGICNSCHVAAETGWYTQTTGANGHPTGQCTVCHSHSADTTYNGEAFKGSGCSGCHGDAGTDRYWPDGSGVHPDDNAGRHLKHIEVIAAKLGYTPATANDAQQKEMCAYCHDGPGVTNHANGVVNVSSMKKLWDASTDDAVWSLAGDGNNGTCATTDCHNNTTTPAGYSWHGATLSTCSMCHDVSPLTDSTHSQHRNLIYNLIDTEAAGNCGYCHDAATRWTANIKPAVNHINGAFVVEGSKITAGTYTGVYKTSKGTCGTNICHNNGRNGAPATTPYTWGTGNASTCDSCHLNNQQGHVPHFSSTGTFTNSFGTLAGGSGCQACHGNSGQVFAVVPEHMNGTINIQAGMGYSSPAANLLVANTGAPVTTCNTTTCHSDGKGVASVTPNWRRVPVDADNCTICHAGIPAGTSHAKHVTTAPVAPWTTAYGLATNLSTIANYDYRCGNCHTTNLNAHIRGTVGFGAVGFNGGTKTCSTTYCHSDGTSTATPVYVPSPAWGTVPAGDNCAICHGNSPTTNAHQVHTVGIHATDIYSGTTGLLTTATATKSHGDPATSTTINCNLCHSETVTMARNKFGSECVSCHSGDAAGTVMGVADKSKHVDGTKQVVFAMTAFKSKAQLRDNITTVPELDNNWTRTNGYKAATSFDQAKLAPAPTWNSGPKTCSTVDCHNGITATWQAPANNCMACHTNLPQ